jgi:hypothetical protein
MKYDVNTKGQDELILAMQKTPERTEEIINKVLHGSGGKEVSMAIIGFMPRSGRSKKHAKDSNSLKQEDINLGFRIFPKGGAASNKGSFGYLVFPNEGRGNKNPVAQEFFGRGLESKEDRLTQIVLEALEQGIKL